MESSLREDCIISNDFGSLKMKITSKYALFILLPIAALVVSLSSAPRRAVPDRLTDQEFWKLVTDSSEPGGYFRSADITNLTSNETMYGEVVNDLINRTKPGGVYLGVGPEQNYNYI